MSAPVLRGAGSSSVASTGRANPGLPTGTVAGDLLIVFIETPDEATTMDDPTGWTEVPYSPQSATATRMTMFYKIAAGGDSLLVAAGSDHTAAVCCGIETGTFDTSTPFNVGAGSADNNTSATSRSIPGATTTVADCLVIAVSSTSRDSSGGSFTSASWANADLTSFAAVSGTDFGTNFGNGGGMAIASGTKATAGAYGSSTVTVVSGGTSAMVSFAIAPPAAASTRHPYVIGTLL